MYPFNLTKHTCLLYLSFYLSLLFSHFLLCHCYVVIFCHSFKLFLFARRRRVRRAWNHGKCRGGGGGDEGALASGVHLPPGAFKLLSAALYRRAGGRARGARGGRAGRRASGRTTLARAAARRARARSARLPAVRRRSAGRAGGRRIAWACARGGAAGGPRLFIAFARTCHSAPSACAGASSPGATCDLLASCRR